MPNAAGPAQGVIFDLDGTLVDAFADMAAAINATRDAYGLDALTVAQVRAEVGQGSEYLVRRLVPLDEARRPEALAHYLRAYESLALHSTRALPGVEATLAALAHLPLAVVTNKPLRHTELILAGLGLAPRFGIVLGGDSLPRRKPDPAPLRHVLAAWGLAPGRVAMVGDSEHDIRAGRAAGTRTVAVTTGVAGRAALQAASPDHLIENLGALPALLA